MLSKQKTKPALWFLFSDKALKTKYFSNRPGPTPGCQLPRPNCPAEALKEQANPSVATKRKRTEALEQGKERSPLVKTNKMMNDIRKL